MLYPRRLQSGTLFLVTAMLATSCIQHGNSPAHESTRSPYAGEEARAVKALAPEEIDGLQSGEGMGLAKVAELNGLPGPRHVIELREELEVTPEQYRRTEAAMKTMRSEAIILGNEIVRTETQLDSLFATFAAAVEPESASDLVMHAANLSGKLRWTHIAAHIAMMDILTEEQRTRYVQLRGYHNHSDMQHSEH